MNVLLVTAGIFHPPYRARLALHEALAQLKDFSFRHVHSLEQLPADLDSFAAVVLYYHQKSLSAAALARLDAFVSHGGGILAIHSATASFVNEQHYFEILGGRFIGHGAVENFAVEQARDDLFGSIG